MATPAGIDGPGRTARDTCPFCGLSYEGAPSRCARCGTLLGEAVEDLRRMGRSRRRLLQSRKALADTFFLVGLLLGGPIITIGGQLQVGAFIVLAGGVASVLRRYTDWSTPGTVLVGSLVAMVAASWLFEPRAGAPEDAGEAREARMAYARALAGQDPDILVEARGPDLVVLWYTLPTVRTGACGAYPPAEVRGHLAQLGFRRIVVAQPNGAGGVCSFAP